jgi:hypothetical protein
MYLDVDSVIWPRCWKRPWRFDYTLLEKAVAATERGVRGNHVRSIILFTRRLSLQTLKVFNKLPILTFARLVFTVEGMENSTCWPQTRRHYCYSGSTSASSEIPDFSTDGLFALHLG